MILQQLLFSLDFSHERTTHNMMESTDDGNETCDEYGYYKCRMGCGHTFRSIQGKER